MTTLAQDLGGVVRLLEKATPGPWHYSEKGFSTKPTPMVYATGQDLNYIAMCRDFGNEGPTLNEENAQAIAAAVNFLRTHSAEIAGALRYAERYRWLREHVTDRFVRNNEHEPCLLLPHNVDYLSPDEIDTAIDSAMQQVARAA